VEEVGAVRLAMRQEAIGETVHDGGDQVELMLNQP